MMLRPPAGLADSLVSLASEPPQDCPAALSDDSTPYFAL